MSQLQDFLLNDYKVDETLYEVNISGIPFPFKMKQPLMGEINELKKRCTKKGETDNELFNNKLIVFMCVEPNFKDAKLQEKFGVIGVDELLNKMFTSKQQMEILKAVNDICGYGDQKSIDELVSEAKN